MLYSLYDIVLFFYLFKVINVVHSRFPRHQLLKVHDLFTSFKSVNREPRLQPRRLWGDTSYTNHSSVNYFFFAHNF